MRRIHVQSLRAGENFLDASQARHARDVLRLREGQEISVFDDAGQVATGTLHWSADNPPRVLVVGPIQAAVTDRAAFALVVASAVPKGERADWMVEKLSELGVDTFIPLATERSVVLPQGVSKFERWQRLAIESAKQCRRPGVMRIEALVPFLSAASAAAGAGWCLSAGDESADISHALTTLNQPDRPAALTLFIGPEGGWSSGELEVAAGAGLTRLRLTPTILRVETAAVAAAAVVATHVAALG